MTAGITGRATVGVLMMAAASLAAPAAAMTVTQPVGSHIALAEFTQPAAAHAATPLVVIVHPAMGWHESPAVAGLRQALAQRGFAVLTPTLSMGVDRRSGDYDCRTAHVHRLGDGVGELDLWVAAVRSAGYRSIWVGGIGLGATVAARFLAANPDAAHLAGGMFIEPHQEPDGQASVQATYASEFGVPLAPIAIQAERLMAAGRGAKGFDVPGLLECRSARVTAESFLSYYGPDRDRDTPHVLERISKPQLVIDVAPTGGARSAGEAASLVERMSNVRRAAALKVQMVETAAGSSWSASVYDEIADAAALFVARLAR